MRVPHIHCMIDHSCAQARAAIFEFIELFYNPVRQHSHLNGLSPMQFERVLHG